MGKQLEDGVQRFGGPFGVPRESFGCVPGRSSKPRWILKTGAQWRMLPLCSQNEKTVHYPFQRQCRNGALVFSVHSSDSFGGAGIDYPDCFQHFRMNRPPILMEIDRPGLNAEALKPDVGS